MGVRTLEDGVHDFHFDGWIHHNYFHDFPQKPDPAVYASGQSDALEICQSTVGTYNQVNAGYYVEYNLVKDHAQGSGGSDPAAAATFDYKCGGVVSRYNTFDNVKGRMDTRGPSLYPSTHESNWLESNSGGMKIHGYRNRIIGNRLVASQILIMAGNIACDAGDQPSSMYSNACSPLIVGNVAASMTIGYEFSNADFSRHPTTNAVIRNHTGPIKLGLQTGTTNTPLAPAGLNFIPAVKLTPGEVGPGALSDASPAYKAARGF
jgi:hypothetical protein